MDHIDDHKNKSICIFKKCFVSKTPLENAKIGSKGPIEDQKQFSSVYGAHSALFDRLGFKISTQKFVSIKSHRVIRYYQKYVKIWTLGSKSKFLALIGKGSKIK